MAIGVSAVAAVSGDVAVAAGAVVDVCACAAGSVVVADSAARGGWLAHAVSSATSRSALHRAYRRSESVLHALMAVVLLCADTLS
jgi:hypothetical protein